MNNSYHYKYTMLRLDSISNQDKSHSVFDHGQYTPERHHSASHVWVLYTRLAAHIRPDMSLVDDEQG